MAPQKNILRLVDFSRKKSRSSTVGVSGLHQSPMSSLDFVDASPRSKPQHLIGLFFAHGSRARRATLPRTGSELSVFTPVGKPAVKIRV